MQFSTDGGKTWVQVDSIKIKTEPSEEFESDVVTVVNTGVRVNTYLTDGSLYAEGEVSWDTIKKSVEV